MKRFEIFHYHSKAEKIICRILQGIALVLWAFFSYLWIDIYGWGSYEICLLIITSAFLFGLGGMLLLFSEVFIGWLWVSEYGASDLWLYIGACIIIDLVISRYGAFGAWMLFRK